MSAFSETALLKKLGELNSSQQSIQTLSLWLIHHRKHHASIVKTWLKELQTAVSEGKKLTFMYLANDVIQNSKKKGPEYGKEFAQILPKVFQHIGESCTSDKLFGSLGRILNIWEERGVYDTKQITEYRARLNKDHKDNNNAAAASSSSSSSATAATEPNTNGSHGSATKEKSEKREKRKHDESKTAKVKRSRPSTAAEEKPNVGQNGDAEHLSPYLPLGEPPEPEDLIKALANIENSASSDAVVRERIANLPPEISEISCLSKLEDKDAAKALAKQVNEAVQLLNEYNTRLAAEMEERTKLASMLRDFQAEQKELLVQAEKRLEEYKQKLNRMVAVQKEIRDHLSNLPDLTQLPDVTGGLAPLPSAGDLFNIH
ncbi:regulation of nuclear pre-mRNA domain-containing protein 1B [Bactrocera tryoni]|uniref:regulation of nuclear pre-mRNA domain-containing protein 1B n=1 Tax=Bactrocera tryoni TaxID=59916 RepID=UPI001A99D0FA|nr:regulation of nuclear pre-mRNA domain-containing protein 1B [Bactrocera tryoni]